MIDERIILIIDDDMEYSCLLQEAFNDAQVRNPVRVINDACSALAYLENLVADPPAHREDVPALVLLDLRMPKLSGMEVLRRVRSNPALAQMPIAVFTGVEAADECSEAIALGASSLHVKPFSYRDLVLVTTGLRERYLAAAELAQAA